MGRITASVTDLLNCRFADFRRYLVVQVTAMPQAATAAFGRVVQVPVVACAPEVAGKVQNARSALVEFHGTRTRDCRCRSLCRSLSEEVV